MSTAFGGGGDDNGFGDGFAYVVAALFLLVLYALVKIG